MEATPTDIPNDATDKILAADFRNIVKKVKEGKTLSQAELVRVHSRSERLNDDFTTWAKNVTRLADILGVTRQTLNRWRKIEGAPQPRPNGWHSVAEWQTFTKAHGLNLNAEDTPSLEMWKLRNVELDARKKEIELGVMLKNYISWADANQSILSGVSKLFSILRTRLLYENAPLYRTGDVIGNSQLNAIALDEAQQMAVEHFRTFLDERTAIPEAPTANEDEPQLETDPSLTPTL